MPPSTNPLLENLPLPAFDRIRPEHVEPAIDAILGANRAIIKDLLEQPGAAGWDGLLQPIEDSNDRLHRAWSPVNHLHAVADNAELRSVYNACLPRLSAFETELTQNEALYRAYVGIAESNEYTKLDTPRRKVIDNSLREFRLSGIGLNQDVQRRFKEVKLQLEQLQTRFDENLLDATSAWSKHITDADQLAGLPDTVRALAAQTARRKELDGWVFTLDFPSYYPVMQYAEDRELRREMYLAYVTRASDQGPHAGTWDNSGIMVEILALRKELAALLGFESYAHYSLERKMADTPAAVLEFLEDLARRSKPVAQREFAELTAFARERCGAEDIQAWDLAYYSEQLRRHLFDFSEEDLRPYFPAPRVIEGMFRVVRHLYGLEIRERPGVSVYHADVEFFDIFDDSGTLRGSFYLDLYAREHKRGGAWMDECVSRRKTAGTLQNPVAYLTCNFSPPVDKQPSLLTHEEVLTLFHEFGHGLHHMLTLVDYPAVAGINGVPWDAVELPSQFMENWCWERESLDLFAGHYQDGTPLPDEFYNKMIRAKTFQSGMQMVRQLEFALFDFDLHYRHTPGDATGIQQRLDDIRGRVAVVTPPAVNRFQHGFSHIFAGGYAAGYYSYKWAEVLSADAFSKFEENGIFDRDTGMQFLHTILEQGGSKDPMDLFVEFRGRKPGIDALLRHSGITPIAHGEQA